MTEPRPALPPNAVFIPSLSFHTTPLHLKELMESYGTVSKVNLTLDDHFKVSGIVEFGRTEDAVRAAAESGVHRIDNVVVHVERAEVNSTVYLGKVPKDYGEPDLRGVVKAFGYEPEKVVVLTDLITKEPKGSAFVKFFSRDDAVGCMNKFRESHPEWTVQWARSDTPTGPPVAANLDLGQSLSIYIGNISPEATESLIRQKFGLYGEIESLNYKPASDDSYASVPAASRAIEKEDGSEWLGRTLRVQVPQSAIKKEKKLLARRRETERQPSYYYNPEPYPYPYSYPPNPVEYPNPYDAYPKMPTSASPPAYASYPNYDRASYPYPYTAGYPIDKRKAAAEPDYHQDYKRRHVDHSYPSYS